MEGPEVLKTLRPSSLGLWSLQDLVDDEHVGEQRADVDRRVDVVDHLRADAGLAQHQPQRRLRGRGVGLEGLEEPVERVFRADAERGRALAIGLRESGQRRRRIVGDDRGAARCSRRPGLLPDPAPRTPASFRSRPRSRRRGGRALRVPPQATFLLCLGTQRSGSWCSRYSRREMVPKIIALVIHSFSGRSAK